MKTTTNGTTAAQVNNESVRQYKVKTLAQVADEVENGNIYHGETRIKIGNFESFADFLNYFNAHYRPMLEEWRDCNHLPNERLFGFFVDDMLSAFAEENG